jgi:hypothetical protein
MGIVSQKRTSLQQFARRLRVENGYSVGGLNEWMRQERSLDGDTR